MKIFLLILTSILLAASSVFAQSKTHYFVGQTEVSEAFWMSIPDSIKNGTGEFSNDTVTIKEIYLPLTHYLDTISTTGNPIIKRHSPEKIAELERILMMRSSVQRKSSLSVQVGDEAPAIDLVNLLTETVEQNLIKPGKCYLLSFWATWCGNCLQELKPDCLPQIAKEFKENPDFIFMTICIDSSPEELKEFFDTIPGNKWAFLAPYTYIDQDRTANAKFGESGVMPLNVVIDREGRIAYIHSGVLTSPAQFQELSEAIRQALENQSGSICMSSKNKLQQ